MLNRIEINKNLIPYTFDITLGGVVWTIRVDYNAAEDRFLLTLYQETELICAGEPLVYGVPLFRDVYQPGYFPALTIVPVDESGQTDTVTWENFCATVFLCVDEGQGVTKL